MLKKLVVASLFAAIGILTSHIIYIPTGVAKCFPVQHAVNVLSAVVLGPWYSTAVAFVISAIRFMMGTGTLLAFPGSMIGALAAGLMYKAFKRNEAAIAGELFGTGVLGSLVAAWMSNVVLGTEKAAFALIIPFAVSSFGGCIIACLLLKSKAVARTLIRENI